MRKFILILLIAVAAPRVLSAADEASAVKLLVGRSAIVEQCVRIGAANVELVNLLEPRLAGAIGFSHPPVPMTAEYEKSRTVVRQWRLTTPIERFREIRKQFDTAGLNLISYVMTCEMDFTDQELDAVFKQMQALKVGFFW